MRRWPQGWPPNRQAYRGRANPPLNPYTASCGASATRAPLSEAPPSATSHSDSGPAKKQGAAPRKSPAQLDRIALCKSAHLIRIKYAGDCVGLWGRRISGPLVATPNLHHTTPTPRTKHTANCELCALRIVRWVIVRSRYAPTHTRAREYNVRPLRRLTTTTYAKRKLFLVLVTTDDYVTTAPNITTNFFFGSMT